MADINQEIEQIVAEMREVGKQAAPCKGGNYNNLLRYNELRERILSKFLEAFDTGGRLEMPTLTLPSEWVSAEDDPPKLTGKYICCVEDIHGHMWSISADYLFEMKTWVGEFGEIKNKVVFWMPLPNPPNM